MDALSEYVTLRHRPRSRWGLACQGNATPAPPQGPRPPPLTVPVAGNDMAVPVASLAACLEVPADESIGRKSARNCKRSSTVRSNAPLARLCECGMAGC